MRMELDREALGELVARQLSTLFLLREAEKPLLEAGIEQALRRCAVCFSSIRNKYYTLDGEARFNPFHSGQYAFFLYFLANGLFKAGAERSLADRVYCLNKTLHCFELYYEVEMPETFFFDHPLGSVLGRASYGPGFTFTQNCTIGNNNDAYPRFGSNVRLYAGVSVVGDCEIGDNVFFGLGARVIDCDVPSNSLVFGAHPDNVIKPRDPSWFLERASCVL